MGWVRRSVALSVVAVASLLAIPPALGDAGGAPEEAVGLRLGRTWSYAYKTVGAERDRDGLHPWSYESTYQERVVRARHLGAFRVLEAQRTLREEKGDRPSFDDAMPTMGTRYYLVRGGEPAYTKWRAYSVTAPPA
jgi:hypothetical protein